MNKLLKSISMSGLLSLALLMPSVQAQEVVAIQSISRTLAPSSNTDGRLAPGEWVLTDQGAAQGSSSIDDLQCKQLALMEQFSFLCFHAAANTSQNSQYLQQLINSLIGNVSALQVNMVNGQCLVLFAINAAKGADATLGGAACQAIYKKVPKARLTATPVGEATSIGTMEPTHH